MATSLRSLIVHLVFRAAPMHGIQRRLQGATSSALEVKENLAHA
jgi:hypothetical protein